MHTDALLALAASEKRVDRRDVEQIEPSGLLVGALDEPRRENGGEVEESAGDGGDGDSVAHGPVGVGEGPSAVAADAVESASVAPRHRHIDHVLCEVDEPPEGGRVAVAEERFRTTGKYGGHPSAEALERRRAERINALVDTVKLATLDPAVDRLTADPEANELPRRDRSMLSGRELHEPTLADAVAPRDTS